jgi:hypothetical protein
MFFCKNIVKFIASSEDILEIAEKPYPAIQNLPSWFINTDRYSTGEPGIDKHGDPTSTIKKCMPVVDLLGAGYHIPLPSDVWLDNQGEFDMRFRWAIENYQLIVGQEPEQYGNYPTPPGFYIPIYKWANPWIVKTPPGWSSLFLHPSHHGDLPFQCIPAIVDTDKHPTSVNLPFYVRKGFDGLIPKGTPMIQVIPFKRENFKSEFTFDRDNKFKKIWDKAHTVFFERYQKFFWTPKKYEQGKVVKKGKCPFGFGS